MPVGSVRVTLKGPLLTGQAPAIIRDTLKAATSDLVGEGERRVKLQLFPGHGLVTGHYRRSIHGEVLSSFNGVINDSNVVYGPWLEGVGSRNQQTRFKGYAMFRRATQQLEKIKGAVVQKRVSQAIRRLG